MLLSDDEISSAYWAEEITIDPYDHKYLQPASYDVHLGSKLLIPTSTKVGRGVDVAAIPEGDEGKLWDEVTLHPHNSQYEYWIPSGGVALGHTEELVTLSPDASLAADIAGCSSLGRYFLFVHVTAGFIDPGWSGRLTLELYNASPWWLRVWEGMRIAQLRFYRMSRRANRSYLDTGHYAGAITVLPGEYHG